jgi:hypothetical protein
MIRDIINDDGAAKQRAAWYAKHGFQAFPGSPLKMFLPIETIRQTYAMLGQKR